MIYVRSKVQPPQKSGPIYEIKEYDLRHAITVGTRIVKRQILLRIHQKTENTLFFLLNRT